MADFNFYINDNERAELISFIISMGGKIIPDLRYPTNDYLICFSTDDYLKVLENGDCKFFVLDDRFSSEPIINSKNRFSKEPFYSIEQRKGGPYIDLIFYLGSSQDAAIPYKRSYISYYEKFIHYDSSTEFKAPDSLKAYYRIIIQFIKSKCKAIKKGGKTFWLSEKVIKEI